jgi:plasmid stabilization system protein ParE
LKFRLLARARRDYSDIADVVSEADTRAALRVIDAIEEGLNHVRRFPFTGHHVQVKGRSLFAWRVSRWLILYEVRDDTVIVRRIVDSARDLNSLNT